MTSLQSEAGPATERAPSHTETAPKAPSAALLWAVAAATGALVANLFYSQPLIAVIGPDLGLRPNLAGVMVSITQIGYALGLFFLVSLADLVENKKLVLFALGGTLIALVLAATSTGATMFFVASLLIGLCSTGAQVLIPFVSQLVPEAQRGRTVGNIMAGLLTGILLARPLALFISASFGWRTVFWVSAVLMIIVTLVLARLMPRHRPRGGTTYGKILVTMMALMRDSPIVRRRAIYQALMFAGFNMFWTAAPVMLAQRFGLSQEGIALFALAGVGGAAAAPIAGRMADGGHVRLATLGAMAVLSLAFLATGWATSASALAVLVVLGIVIDAAVQTNQVVGQRVIFSLPAAMRGRINAVYMTTSFVGGAIGSTLATTTYHSGGWTVTAITGAVIGGLALLIALTERSKAEGA
ncbi:MAG TPA: MFS transporter [Devosiaceae bacterium]|nr:MFS transporter [Devosiaceae bacterium]